MKQLLCTITGSNYKFYKANVDKTLYVVDRF